MIFSKSTSFFSVECRGVWGDALGKKICFFWRNQDTFFGNLFILPCQKTLTLDPMDAGGVGSGQGNIENAAGFAWSGCGMF